MDGITCVTSKGDGRYFISNGKDQTMKLWDIRKMTDPATNAETQRVRSHWDYRYQNFRYQHRVHSNDLSIMTYVGHRVLQTLIRCYFSPPMSTGQRFVYSGSQDGSVYVYDLLTGALVHKLVGHSSVVRDVTWHPYLPMLLSSSWDCTINHWTYRRSYSNEERPTRRASQNRHFHEMSSDDDDDEMDAMPDDNDPDWEDVVDEEEEEYVPMAADSDSDA